MVDITDGKFRPRPLTNVFRAQRPGRFQLYPALTGVLTLRGEFTLQAGDYLDVTPLIPNLGPSFNYKMRFSLVGATSSGDNTLNLVPTGGAWSDIYTGTAAAGGTFAGLTSETPVVSRGPRFSKRSLKRTDAPTRARAVIAWMMQVETGTQLTCPNLGSYAWQYENQLYPQAKVSEQAVAGVDTLSAVTNTARTPEGQSRNPYHIGFEYTSTKWGEQYANAGDSIQEGLGGDARWFGVMQRAACAISTPDAPVEFFNCAQHAQTPDQYMANLAQQIDLVRPTKLFFSEYSNNAIAKSATSPGLSDTSKMDEVYRGLSTLLRAVATLQRPPQLFATEPLPCSLYDSTTGTGSTTGANDALRVGLITELATMGNDPTVKSDGTSSLASGAIINRHGITLLKGMAAVVSDPTLVNGQVVPLASMMGSDRQHWNEAGLSAMAAVVEKFARAG